MIPKLWMARRFPHSRVTAVSNSNSQREFIEGEAARCGLTNLRVA
jgi:cyclopropane-fatty-acyl-phospholipid synthase